MEMDVACWKAVDVNYSNDSSIFTHTEIIMWITDEASGRECCHFPAGQPLCAFLFPERHLQQAPRHAFAPIVFPRQSNSAAPSVN